MNLPVSRTLLPLAFILFLFSCDDPSEIGLELQGQGGQVGTIYKDDFAVEAATVLIKDSVVSFGARPTLVGRVGKNNDNETSNPFGIITARTYAELSLRQNNQTFGANTGVADRVTLSLSYTYWYGDTTKAMTLNVYELAERFDEKRTYYTSTTLPKGPLLGTVTFIPRPSARRTSVEAPDSPLPNPLVFDLNKELGNRFLALEGTIGLSSQQEFAKVFNGLVIEPAAGSVGAMLGLNLQAETSLVTLHYTAADGTKKTSTFPFFEIDPRFNEITTDRTGTALAGLVNSGDAIASALTGNETYIQSGTGLRTKITLPDLASLQAQGRTIAINRAELVVPVKRTPSDPPLTPAVFLYETNSTNQILRAADGITPRRVQRDGGAYLNRNDSPAQFSFDNSQQAYILPFTTYLQALLNGTKPNNGLLISSGANANLINRAIIKATPTERIRLRVYYSVID